MPEPPTAKIEIGELQVEQLDVPGLTYARDFLSESEEAALIAEINRNDWIGDLSRRVQHYEFIEKAPLEAGLSVLLVEARTPYIIPSIPPMPPGGIAGPLSFFGFSATVASVVINNPAIDAAFCNAARTTFVGSRIPIFTRSPYSSV